MPNEFYDHTGFPQTNTRASSALMRAELDAVEQGFDKLPVLAGNGSEIVTVKADATGLESKTQVELHLVRDDGDVYTGAHDFTGATITAPTQSTADSSTKVATTAFVNNVAMNAALPAQSIGDAGKYIKTNGSVASWSLPFLPPLLSGQYLLNTSNTFVNDEYCFQKSGSTVAYSPTVHDESGIYAANPSVVGYYSAVVTGTAAGIVSVAYGNSTYAAVASNCSITTTDRTSVSYIPRGTPTKPRYRNGMYLCGIANYVANSSNGTDWTYVLVAPSGVNVNDVTYGGGFYVAVCSNGVAYASSDLTTWSSASVTSGYSNQSILSVDYEPTSAIFMCIAQVSNSTYLFQSSNGTSWSGATTLGSNVYYSHINCTGTGSYKSTVVGTTSNGYYAVDRATGGANFNSGNANTTGTGNLNFSEFIPGLNQWIVGGSGGGLFDATVLSLVARTSGTTQTLTGCAKVGSTVIAVGSGDVKLTSTDGVTWSSGTVGLLPASAFSGVCSDGTTAYLLGNTGEIKSTTNGSAFVSVRPTWVPLRIRYLGTNFIVCNTTGSIGYGPTMGSLAEKYIAAGAVYDVAYSGSIYVALVGAGVPYYAVTLGGAWAIGSGSVSNLTGVRYFSGINLFIAVGYSGAIATSADGLSWTSRTSHTASNLYDVVYANGLYLVNGASSTNGIDWIADASFSAAAGTWAAGTAECVMPASSGNSLVYNGTTTAIKSTATSNALTGVAFGGGHYVVGGGSGYLAFAPDGVSTPSIITAGTANTAGSLTQYIRTK